MLDEDLDDLLDDEPESTVADALIASTPKFKRRDDPSLPFYPRGLILDIVLKSAPLDDLLTAYNISREAFKAMVEHPVFRQDVRDMKDKLKEEGFSFRVKAQAQAEAYLHTAWNLIHDPETPANVRADLIKWTTKVGGLEAPPASQQTTTSQDLTKLAEDLKNLPADQIELRAMSIILRKSQNAQSMQDVGHVIDS